MRQDSYTIKRFENSLFQYDRLFPANDGTASVHSSGHMDRLVGGSRNKFNEQRSNKKYFFLFIYSENLFTEWFLTMFLYMIFSVIKRIA